MKSGMHVIFGTGPLGKALMEELVYLGRSVRMANRSGAGLSDLPPEVELVQCDASDAEQVTRVCKDADVVYNCTGLPYPQWNQLHSIMSGLVEGVSRTHAILVYADNLYAYGPVEGKMKESSPYNPVGRKTGIRANTADLLMQAHRQNKVRATVGRGPDFYGPNVTLSILGAGVFGNLIANKAVDALGNIDAPHSLIYIKDFARGLVTLGETEQSLGEIWHIPCDPPTTIREVTGRVAAQLGKMPKYRIASKPVLTFLSMFNSEMREFKEIFYQFHNPFIVDDSKFRHAFGSKVTPQDESIQMTLEWYLNAKERILS
jgi:nucleoside-diphosphate-sugar epimerase